MKNVLFATTALVAMGGAAWADAHAGISLTGSARLGIGYDEAEPDGNDVFGTSRVRLGLSASGTSDSGLTFGAAARLDQGDATDQSDDEAGAGSDVSTNGSVFVSGAFGTLSYQDVDDAVENRVSHVNFISLTGLRDDPNEIVRSAQPGPIIRYDYDAGAFGLSVSTGGDLEDFQAGVSYSGDFGGTSISVGLGYDEAADSLLGVGDHFAASLGVGFGAIAVDVAYATNDDLDDVAVSVTYDAGALDVNAFYRTADSDGVIFASGEFDAYGLGASYDLGGGLSLRGAVGNVDDGTDDFNRAEIGLNMSF